MATYWSLPRLLWLLALARLVLSSQTATAGSTALTQQPVLQYLQSESIALSSAQQAVQAFLQSKKIPVGGLPRSLRKDESQSGSKVRIALSTTSNNLECRVALGRAPIGRKCVSPCGCTGSQQWIQFSELNHLRRKEPAQWTKCQTCQQTFDYSMISSHGGVAGNIVSLLLDNVKFLRLSLIGLTFGLGYAFSFNMLAMRFFASRVFWQQYPKWVKIVNLPLVLKFWGGKIVLQYLYSIYLYGEGLLLEQLADLETALIEPNLPAENEEKKSETRRSDAAEDDEVDDAEEEDNDEGEEDDDETEDE